jgi:hypothetical protein
VVGVWAADEAVSYRDSFEEPSGDVQGMSGLISAALHRSLAANVADGSWLCENSKIGFACRNFVSVFVNLKANSAVDCCWQKTIEKTILRPPRVRTFLHSLGQKRPFSDVRITSAFPPVATE